MGIFKNEACLTRLSRWAGLAIPLSLLALLGLWLTEGQGACDSRALRVGVNFVFSLLAGGGTAFLFGRAFLAGGRLGLLAFGGGAVVWAVLGFGAVVRLLAGQPDFDANVSSAIRNVCLWEVSLCQLVGAVALPRRVAPCPGRGLWLAGAYALAAVATLGVALAAVAGDMPLFFVAGSGATPVRLFLLGSTTVTLVLAAALLGPVTEAGGNRFLRRYQFALLLLALACGWAMLVPFADGMPSWAIRVTYYLGGATMVVAAGAVRGAGDLDGLRSGGARQRYGVAIAIVLVAAILRLVFLQSLGNGVAFVTFYPAVVLAALYGGLRAGALATVVSALIADYFWIDPVGSFFVSHVADALAIAVFVANNIFVCWIIERWRQANTRLERGAATRREQLERLVAQRTADLRRSERRFQLALANAPLAVFELDLNWRYTWIGVQSSLTGFGEGTFLGKTDYDVFNLEVANRLADLYRRVAATGQQLRQDVTVLSLANDTPREFDLTLEPLCDDGGTLVGIIGAAIDITARKRIEQGLILAKAEADRSVLARSKFLAAASHDLRQPVQSLVLLLAALKSMVTKPQVTRAVGLMESALDGLNGLLSSILDLSRLDAGVVMPQMGPVDLGALCARLAREYALLAGGKGLRLRAGRGNGTGRSDPVLLERVLRNLIENAIRYTVTGGIVIGVRHRGERVRIDVIDSGIGIAADKLPHIFEEFYQVGNPGRDRGKGLGLGLSIVGRLAGLLGAELVVASREGHGTRFSLLMPRDQAQSAAAAGSPPLGEESGRVLVVEDDDGVRNGLRLLIEGWGYKVAAVASGEEALALGAAQFDAIVADHRLGPGLSGTETAKRIRAQAGWPIPTLVITGDTAPERISEVHNTVTPAKRRAWTQRLLFS